MAIWNKRNPPFPLEEKRTNYKPLTNTGIRISFPQTALAVLFHDGLVVWRNVWLLQ
jgi:hypothetical protein